MEARSGEEEEISGDEEPADGEDIANSVSIVLPTAGLLLLLSCCMIRSRSVHPILKAPAKAIVNWQKYTFHGFMCYQPI